MGVPEGMAGPPQRLGCCSSPLHAGATPQLLAQHHGTPKLVRLPRSGCCPPAPPDPQGKEALFPNPARWHFSPLGLLLRQRWVRVSATSYAHLGNEGVIAFPALYLQHLLLRFQTCASAPGVGGDLSVRACLAVCCGSKGKGVLKKICM